MHPKRSYGRLHLIHFIISCYFSSVPSKVPKSRHHGKGSTSLSPRKATKFVVETRELSRISEEERSVEVPTAATATTTAAVAPSSKSYSCPPHLPQSPRARNLGEQGDGGHHHHHHHVSLFVKWNKTLFTKKEGVDVSHLASHLVLSVFRGPNSITLRC